MTPATAPRSPRLVVKVLGFAFAVIACVIGAVFVLFSWQANTRLTRAIVENLEESQRRFATLDARLRREHTLQAMTLAENPTLKAAVDTYYSERGSGLDQSQLLSTVETELEKLQQIMAVPALSVTDVRGVILASAGPLQHDWPPGARVRLHVDEDGAPVETVVLRNGRQYAATAVPLVLGRDVIGEFFLASPLDDAYAVELARESRADIAILLDGRVIASSTPSALREVLEGVALPLSGTVVLGGDEFVVQRLSAVDTTSVYALGSVSAAAQTATSEAGWVLLVVAAGALLLAAGGSWWLAQTVARPIDTLTDSLARMAKARDLDQPLPRSGGSRELDTLAATFDELRTAVSLAEAESEEAYLGVIGALAAALDARDPYTAGHSQRVADLSVAIGRQLELPDVEIETLRLGALLHDIGKIGVSDAILRKPTKLTADEFEQIKLHPTLGARILKPLRFLDAQLAVVELHHERPDGRGYPHGLTGDEIPLFARIVHVADAFDAMTSARAYRSALPVATAFAELWRLIGVDFDAQVVQALASLPIALVAPPQIGAADARDGRVPAAMVPFPIRPETAARHPRLATEGGVIRSLPALVCIVVLGAAIPASAQDTAGTRAVALDTVVGVQDFFDDAGTWKTQIIIDPFATVAVAPRLQLSVRPLVWRVMSGDWETYLVHASIRYEFDKGSKWRIEAGKFTSPVGLGMTENRASVNDSIIWWHRGYYSFLPAIGGGAAPHALIASIYPLGVQVNTSSAHWDARAALIDRAPTDFFHTDDAPRRANGVLGAGISPRQGMRVGAATAWGHSGDAAMSEPYTLVNVEGEFAFGYTRISGEWTHDRFATPSGDASAQGMTLQARQTLTPRVYVHGRATVIESSSLALTPAAPVSRTSWYVDSTVGVLVSPEATVRVAHSAIRKWNVAVDHQVGVSVVWSRRWW